MNKKQVIVLTFSSIILFKVYRVFKHLKREKLVRDFFCNKVVLITGSSSGLGAAFAEKLHKLNCQVILCSRREDELKKVKESLMQSAKKPLNEPHVLVMDVTETADQIKEKLDQIVDKFGCIDVLINNAGISSRGEAMVTTDKVFHKIMDVNFYGPIKLSRLILNYMIKENNKNIDNINKHKFAIINIGSVLSLISAPYKSAYSASKFALSAYSDALRTELFENSNIRILNAYLGYINTPILINSIDDSGETLNKNDDNHKNGYSPEYVANELISAIAENKKEIILAIFLHRIFIGMRFFFPNCYHHLAQKLARKTYFNRYN